MSDDSHKEDLTGRSRLVRNAIVSWASYFLILIAGFIMPRMIDVYVGQTALGIWDFSWSVVNYLGFAGLGIGSAVNRYVAKYRIENRIEELNGLLSSVFIIQRIIAITIFVATTVIWYAFPYFYQDKFAGDTLTAQFIILMLGYSIAIQMWFDLYRGVISGCHRWDIYNGLQSTTQLLTVLIMLIALVLGGGLKALAVIYIIVTFCAGIVRMRIAYNIFPQIDIKYANSEKRHVYKVIKYGSKTIISSMPPVVLLLTSNIFLASKLGPAALAIFSRPAALVRHIETFMNKFSHILTPTAGSLSNVDKSEELKRFLFVTTKSSAAISAPLFVFLAVYGDLILKVWMGDHYVNQNLAILLAIGYFIPISQGPVIRILMGLNKHGFIGFTSLAIVGIGLMLWVSYMNTVGWSMELIALMIGTTFTLTNGLIIPIYACYNLKINYIRYVIEVFTVPVLASALLVLWLLISKTFLGQHIIVSFCAASFGGAAIISFIYWYYLLDVGLKEKIRSKVIG
jgi:O-antigen/teichoic acid export membrane protein